MEWILIKQKFSSICVKIFGTTSAIGGVYTFVKDLLTPDMSLKESLTSPAAIFIYIMLLITAVFVLLNEKYKALQKDNERLNKKIKELNLELNEASARIEAALRNGQIVVFKNKFFLTTPKLYADLADKIHNDITISRLDVYNTIETTGVATKRDSAVRLSIQGIVEKDNVNQIQILVAGDSIVKWKEINLEAFEIIDGKKVKLNARIADNGQDSFLKQVVISYANKKKRGDLISLIITWKWPNMLNIEEDDYTTLPIALSKNTNSISMTIKPKYDLKYAETSVYKYVVGCNAAEHIVDLRPDKNGIISFTEDSPEYKACYILYYKIKNDR